jgi:ABC-2 type transport system ATP-binding protein
LLRKHFPRGLVRVPLDALPDRATPPPEFEIQGSCAVAATNDIDRVLAELKRHAVALDELHIGTPTLDDLFLKLTGHGLRES